MLLCDNLTYADLFKLLEEAQVKLGRADPSQLFTHYQNGTRKTRQIIIF